MKNSSKKAYKSISKRKKSEFLKAVRSIVDPNHQKKDWNLFVIELKRDNKQQFEKFLDRLRAKLVVIFAYLWVKQRNRGLNQKYHHGKK